VALLGAALFVAQEVTRTSCAMEAVGGLHYRSPWPVRGMDGLPDDSPAVIGMRPAGVSKLGANKSL